MLARRGARLVRAVGPIRQWERVGAAAIAGRFGVPKLAPDLPSAVSVRAFSSGSAATSAPMNLGVIVVPQQFAYVVERFGKYARTLDPGIHLLIPVVDRIAYVHDLRERVVNVPNQTAITSDNVTIQCDGVLYVQIHDPYAASYGVSDAVYAVAQLAQTTMRSELGKITLDKTFEERESLNSNIVEAVNDAARAWGITCLRYEIRDITPPPAVKASMDLQAEAERRKRAEILESEGEREAAINAAEGQRQSIVLKAQGDAAATIARAEAAGKGIERLANAVRGPGGHEAVSMRIAEQYLSAFARIAQKGNTILLPASTNDPASMVTQALAVFDGIQRSKTAVRDFPGSDHHEPQDTSIDNQHLSADISSAFDAIQHAADDVHRATNEALHDAKKKETAKQETGERSDFVPKPF